MAIVSGVLYMILHKIFQVKCKFHVVNHKSVASLFLYDLYVSSVLIGVHGNFQCRLKHYLSKQAILGFPNLMYQSLAVSNLE